MTSGLGNINTNGRTPPIGPGKSLILSIPKSRFSGIRRALLCVNNSFHSEPKLLSSRLWGANTHPSTMKTFANHANPGDEQVGFNHLLAVRGPL